MRTRVASSGWASSVKSEMLNKRAVVEIVAPPVPVERAIRITGSFDGATSAFSLDLLTTEPDSTGHWRLAFSDFVSDEGSCCWACANRVKLKDEQTKLATTKKIAILLMKSISIVNCAKGRIGRAGHEHLTTKCR